MSLSVLGFGMGNYNDELMQRLAQNGNGNAAYIDSLSEARKVLLEEAASTLVTIAKDVKIQVEFNPAAVSEYRLIGYEIRMLAREDFRNDRVDAGEIGAGHTVTAIYELTPPGAGGERIAPLRYQDGGAEPGAGFDCELAFLKLRYKLPDAESSTLITRPVTVAGETPVDGTPAAVEADDENRPWLGGGFPSAQGRLHRLGSMAPRPARPTHESLCGVGARSFMCPTRVRELELQSVHCPMLDRPAARGARRRDMGAGPVVRCPDALVRAVSGRNVRDGAGAVRGLVRRTFIRWCLRGRRRASSSGAGARRETSRAPRRRDRGLRSSPP